jgi:hypothetical protein
MDASLISGETYGVYRRCDERGSIASFLFDKRKCDVTNGCCQLIFPLFFSPFFINSFFVTRGGSPVGISCNWERNYPNIIYLSVTAIYVRSHWSLTW